MAAEFIYTCYKLARFYPPDRTILEDISLSFYPGAKIGVIGSNGSGKSSLLRIMAGKDDGYTGEARLTPGFTVGILEQEPQLDPAKDVLGNVMDGVAPIRDMLARYEEVTAMWGEPDADFDKIGVLQAELEAKIQAADAWSLERNVEIAMDALRCPPNDADVTKLSGGERRRVALCRLLLSRPDLLLLDEPTNHLDAESVDWLERYLQEYQCQCQHSLLFQVGFVDACEALHQHGTNTQMTGFHGGVFAARSFTVVFITHYDGSNASGFVSALGAWYGIVIAVQLVFHFIGFFIEEVDGANE
jgi:ABC-type Mn2+/Zn2+ transport system ATPase subunit